MVEFQTSSYGFYRQVNTNYTLQLPQATGIVQEDNETIKGEDWSN